MMFQWQEEMDSKFGVPFRILDRDFVRKLRRERGYGVNPWAANNRFIVSHNLIRDEEYASDLRDWLGSELVRPRTLLILDEAHHAAPASASTYAVSSQFTRRIQELAPKFEHKLFLSATPHNGHSNSFSMLMSILDPQRFCPGVKVRPKDRDEVLVYRLKDDLRKLDISFPQRKIEPVVISAPVKGTPELELAEMLELYCTLREERLRGHPTKIRNASAFLKSGLQQRLLSSVEAFWRTLSKHHETVRSHMETAVTTDLSNAILQTLDENALTAIGDGADNEIDDEFSESQPVDSPFVDGEIAGSQSAIDDEAEKQTVLATHATMTGFEDPRFRQELRLLEKMIEMASKARLEPDEKLKAIFRYVDEHMLKRESGSLLEPRRWTNHRLIVFTEYDDTLTFVRKHLEDHIRDTTDPESRILIYHGKSDLENRRQIKESFNTDPAISPVRILLATDAAREGLNLQYYCNNLFHFDIPWNPTRLEQRNGRIDRKLQPQPVVFCRYFEFANRAEDRILRTIVEKTDKIYRELGGFGKVVDRKAIDRLRKKGIDRAAISEMTLSFGKEDEVEKRLAEQALIEVFGEESENSGEAAESISHHTPMKLAGHEAIDQKRRDRLTKSVEKCRSLLETSKQWLDCRADQFRAAIDCSLKLMDIESGLRPESLERPKARRYFLPLEHLDKRQDWRETVNLLRGRRKKGEPYGEWLRRCPVRPVVFEDPIRAREEASDVISQNESTDFLSADPVHLHLEHRLVQRLLGKFQAQGFAAHDISRACLAVTPGSTPLVFLIARHCLYGENASRLHEDLVVVCSEYVLPESRLAPLAPVPPEKLTEETCLRRLDEALLQAAKPRIPEALSLTLLESAQRDVQELRSHIQSKADKAEKSIKASLARIAEEESAKTRTLLLDLKSRIESALAKRDEQDSKLGNRGFAERPGQGELLDVSRPPTEDEIRLRQERAREKKLMLKRLEQLAAEIEEEPIRILSRYRVVNSRVDPVGIVYLWPEQG
jgi:hypothetical protein